MSTKWPAWAKPILSFLAGKRLLIIPSIEPKPSNRISVKRAVRVGLELEPRVIEVLPAAIIHFPRSFVDLDAMPEKLREVVGRIRAGKGSGPSLASIPYTAMKRWADMELTDKRVVPVSHRRVMRSYRFHPDALARLKRIAQLNRTTETEALERLIEQAGAGS